MRCCIRDIIPHLFTCICACVLADADEEWYKDGVRASPVHVKGMLENGKVVQVSAAAASTCAITNKGEAFCFGQNLEGEMGIKNEGKSSFASIVLDHSFLNITLTQ